MRQIIEAVYDGTVLRPVDVLTLEPNTRVRLTLEVLEVVEQPRQTGAESSFLETAKSLRLSGPSDWSSNFDGSRVSPIHLNLLVLKTHDLPRLLVFYELLGLKFTPEQHGKGPVHYSTQVGTVVLELYPLPEGERVDATTRLGFAVTDLVDLVGALPASAIRSPLKATPRGQRVVVCDPDGRTLELTDAAE